MSSGWATQATAAGLSASKRAVHSWWAVGRAASPGRISVPSGPWASAGQSAAGVRAPVPGGGVLRPVVTVPRPAPGAGVVVAVPEPPPHALADTIPTYPRRPAPDERAPYHECLPPPSSTSDETALRGPGYARFRPARPRTSGQRLRLRSRTPSRTVTRRHPCPARDDPYSGGATNRPPCRIGAFRVRRTGVTGGARPDLGFHWDLCVPSP
ncbi:hypothetical protein GCM10020295_45090 [Streptomyces cinereospinus]